jgi:A-macroglobulin TED domain/Alpha-2-macroglobulin family/MG2 domain/A-macroglobulin receptor binding domain/Alpha-2-macroglobulin bait region domain
MPRLIPWGRGGLLCALGLVIAAASTTARAAPNRRSRPLELQLRQGQARFEGKWLRVRVGWRGLAPAGALEVRLLDLGGRSLATATHPVATRSRGPAQLRLPVPARHRRSPDLLRLTATFTPQGSNRSNPRSVVALSEIGDMPFVWLRGQAQLTAGSRAALRITVRDLQSRPLPGARVTLAITAKGRTLTTRGVTDGQGGLQLGFDVDPAWAGQTARLKVTARTAVFSRTLRQRIQIRRAVQSLLTTDKPIYQPGQTVHVRLLVLRQPSRKPLARASVVISALDNRGNRLSRKKTRTDEFGVAWTRVVLSEHAAVGPLTLQARVRADARSSHTTQVKVRVFRYRVPTFRLKILTDRGHYRPGGRLRATVEARYLQGKPVPAARVRVKIRLLGKSSTCGSRRHFCRHFAMSPRLLATVKGSTDRRGRLRVRALIPRTIERRILLLGGIRIQLRATVTEPGGHRRTIVRTLPVSHQGVLLAALPEAETLVPGVVQRVFVIAAHPDGTPAPGQVKVDYWEVGKKGQPSILRRARVRTDDAGVAAISVKPTDRPLRLRLSAVDRRGLNGYREVVLKVGSNRVLVQPQRSVWKGGEPLRVTVHTAGLSGRVYLDVKHRNQTVQTATTTLIRGRATLTVRTPPSVDGLVTVIARVGGPGLRWHRGWAPVLVQSARRLHLRIRAHRKRYRPGDKARLHVKVTDEHGRGQRVALGLTVVDQGVYVLAGKRPGGQHNRFLLEHAARTTKTTLAGWTPERLLHTPRSATRRWLAATILARLRAGGFTVAPDSLVRRGSAHFEQYRRQIKVRVSRRLTRWFKGRFRTLSAVQQLQWIYHHRLHPLCPREMASIQSAQQLVKSGHLTTAALTDPWGTPLTWTEYQREGGPDHIFVKLQSAGPDASWSTVDDLTAGPYKLLIPKLRRKKCSTGIGGRGFGVGSYRARSPRVFSSRASVSGGLSLAAGDLPTYSGDRPKGRVRRNFRETLVTLPGLRTDAQGHATVNLRLADNITTWVVSSIASGLMGRLGGAVARVRAFQPFYVDMLLPQRLTRTDEVEVPVVVHNYSDRAATVRLRLQGSAWLGAVRRPTINLRLEPGPQGPRLLRTLATATGAERIVIVPPQSVTSTRFRIRALRVGRGSVIVHAQTAGATDSVERTTRILPEGRAQARGVSGFLSGTVDHSVTLPTGFVPDSQRLVVTLEPNLLAASLSSLDSLLRKPHGCMEQSSAVTYPNILALRHLRRSRTTDPKRRQVIAKAKRLVNAGYQRLLGFEVAGGGFSLYGNSPADVSLSALGLAQLTDLATVRYVDPRVVARTRRHLLRRQSPSGSWKPEGYVDLGGGDPLTRRYVVTAYVTWLLARSSNRHRPVARAIHRALGFLRTHLYLVRNNPYALALAANAAATPGLRSHHPFTRRLQRLLTKLARTGRGTHWRPSPGHRTVFAGNGQAAAQETTALALLALRRVPGAASLVSGGMRFLLKERQPAGAWSTTRATVLALLALLRLKPHPSAGPRKVRVYDNGQLRGELRPTPTGATTQSLDLSAGLSAATHHIRLVPVGGRGGLYRIGLRYHSRHRAPQVRGRPRIRVRYSRLRLRPGRSVKVNVRLENPTQSVLLAPMVEIGLPPGFELHNPGLEGFAARAGVKRTERRPGKLLLYFTSLPKGATTFSFRLRARFPLRVQIPSSQFYEYYQPEHPSITAPAVIVVERPKVRLASLRDLIR